MPIELNTVTEPLPRNELAKFLPNDRSIRAIEGMQTDVTETIPDAVAQIIDLTNELLAAPYIAWEASSTLENERIINAGDGIAVTIGLSLVSISLTSTAVTPGVYGDAANIPNFTVDAFGRLTDAGSSPLNTDNITEGGTNLFYTDARARASLSAGTGIDYDSGTGVIDLEDTAVTPDSYGSATEIPVIDIDQQGRITGASTASIPVLASGTYTPTLTNVTNVSSSTAYECQYMRVGDCVTVSGRVDITPTASTAATTLRISLPIASNFAGTQNCGGTASTLSVSGEVIAINADSTNDAARMQWTAGTTGAFAYQFIFMYRII